MRGQWIGVFEGTNSGVAIVELDDMGDHYEGSAFAYSDNPSLPSLWAFIRTLDKGENFELNLKPKPIDEDIGLVADWHRIKDRYPGITLSPDLRMKFEFTSDELKLVWNTPIETVGTATLWRSRGGEPSDWSAP